MIDGGHIQEQAAARALRALPAEDEGQIDRHVDICPDCKQLLDEAQETAGLLALSVRPAPPPSYCKKRLFERIDRDEFLRRPTSRAARPAIWAGRAATALIVLGLLAWNMRLQREVTDARMVQSVLFADWQPQPLEPDHPSAASSKARLYVDQGGTTAVLVIENLQPLPSDKVYQVWVADEHRQHPMETFRVAHEFERVVMRAPEPLDHFKWVMVSVENEGGSQKPSDTTVLFGDL